MLGYIRTAPVARHGYALMLQHHLPKVLPCFFKPVDVLNGIIDKRRVACNWLKSKILINKQDKNLPVVGGQFLTICVFNALPIG